MRGKVSLRMPDQVFLRITPAYAGKREGTKCVKINHKDHPRLCGEKLRHHRGVRQQKGITPAYAGKSGLELYFSRCFQDHPRLCGEKRITEGEHKKQCRITPAYAGKSPRR